MEIESLIKEKKEVQTCLLNFIDFDEDCDTNLQEFLRVIDEQKITQNRDKFLDLLQLVAVIAENHHRDSNFTSKLESIFVNIINKDKCLATDSEIYHIFESNKKALLLLFERKLIIPEGDVIEKMMTESDSNGYKNYLYFYKGIKGFISKSQQEFIESKISHQFNISLDEFEKKCKEGENDSYICQLIREDSLDEFIAFHHRTNFPFTNIIPNSFFETNRFLLDQKSTTLIEYSAFCGSIGIFKYLRMNNVKLRSSLWGYAIHSNNAELIAILEENKIRPPGNSYRHCFKESIKCHHNEISDYIKDSLLKKLDYNYYNSSDDEEFKEEEDKDDIIIDDDDEDDEDDIIIDDNEDDEDDEIEYFYFGKQFTNCMAQYHNYFYYLYFSSDIADLISNPKTGIPICRSCFSLTKITIPDSCSIIGPYAFDRCSFLTEISFGANTSVTKIKENAFERCSSLVSFSIPSSVTEIGKSAFFGCTNLVQITFEKDSPLTIINQHTFANCSSLTHISIPPHVKEIDDFAFLLCSKLEKVEIQQPAEIKISKYAFMDCSSLTNMLP